MKRTRNDQDSKKPGEAPSVFGDEEQGITKPPFYRGGPIRSVEGWIVFITGLHEETREDDVVDAFTLDGGGDGKGPQALNLVRVNFDRKTGKCKGYAIVEYNEQTQAQDAINKLHGTELLGKTIGVHWAFVKPIEGGRQS